MKRAVPRVTLSGDFGGKNVGTPEPALNCQGWLSLRFSIISLLKQRFKLLAIELLMFHQRFGQLRQLIVMLAQ